MASIHRDPRSPSGVWYCAYARADGQRSFRSTGTKDKVMANIICESWEQAEREAAQGEISQDRIAAILNETLQRCGIKPVESPRVGDWLKEWLQSKTQVAPATQRSYRQAVTEFLEYLGEAGARRRLEAITEKDVAGFIAAL